MYFCSFYTLFRKPTLSMMCMFDFFLTDACSMELSVLVVSNLIEFPTQHKRLRKFESKFLGSFASLHVSASFFLQSKT